jgi:hypothetical protein
MTQAWRDAMLRRALIVQVLMEFGGYPAFHRLTDRIAGQPRAEALAESGGALAVIPWTIAGLPDGRPGSDSPHGSFADCRLFPVLPIGMLFVNLRARGQFGGKHQHCHDPTDSHT